MTFRSWNTNQAVLPPAAFLVLNLFLLFGSNNVADAQQCLADPGLEALFLPEGATSLPLAGSCCQKDICGIPCPAPVRTVQCTRLTKIVSSYCWFILSTRTRFPGWQAHQRLVHHGGTERNLVVSRQLADTTAASCSVFHTIHRLRHLRGRFRRALRHTGRVDHFLRQGQVGKLFRRGTIVAHLDLVVYARSSSGGRKCSYRKINSRASENFLTVFPHPSVTTIDQSLLSNSDLSYKFHFYDGACLTFGIAASLVLNSIFLAHHIHADRVMTLPDMYAKRYGRTVEIMVALYCLTSFVFLLAGNLLGLGIIIDYVWGLERETSIWIASALVWIYTVSGGLFSVAYTDVMQGVIGWTGCFVCAIYIIHTEPHKAPPPSIGFAGYTSPDFIG
jgi:Sodium:solute symporter family